MFEIRFYIFAKIFLIVFHVSIGSSETQEIVVQRENLEEKLKTIDFGDVCGGTITESRFLLKSPGYPQSYPSNLSCQLSLNGRNCSAYYKFQFIDFNIEKSPGCVKDRLEIGLLDALCGTKNGTKTYLAKNGTLALHFKTDEEYSGGGYEILVTRIEECINEQSDSHQGPITRTGQRINNDLNLRQCCLKNLQTSQHFTLKSPNFPQSMSYPDDCILQIHKASSDICRLRIIFKFFWFGNSLDCSEGFLQIDGKIICGCKKELKLLSVFEENVKILRFSSRGLVRNSYSGFVAEIFQDECPKKVRMVQFDVDNQTVLNLPKPAQDVKFHTPSENLYSFENSEVEREPNDFLATEDISGFLGNNANNFDSCLQWNQAQFDEIFYGKNIEMENCQSSESRTREDKKCLKFIEPRGFIFSPGYPFFYPGNLRTCYRFDKLPGSCAVRFHFFDFRIGRSESCFQERLEVGERAYCGFDLWNKIVTLEFRNKDSVHLDFITTTPKCVQGFKAFYEYLPCEEISTPAPLPPPMTRIFPVPPPVTEKPKQQCGGVVKKEIFSLTNEEGSSECVFIVEKFSEEVCQLILNFERFSLDCSSEIFKVNGKPYCGSQIGTVEVDAEEFPVEITYSNVGYKRGGVFKILGVQDTMSCSIPEPPAQLN
ncbi:uncharacterized protein LOC123311201 [Coccinella septempunctata]|uniref:uncharacterized protein LOC123311201 n=1 Tax=Coccinella septempunctata TaxID=41139 RepID=UPI001D082F6C|nr:uncharacterized protein LOC123311201 [Coccinella septempunctata]